MLQLFDGRNSKSGMDERSKRTSRFDEQRRRWRIEGYVVVRRVGGKVNESLLIFLVIVTDRRASEIDGAVEHHPVIPLRFFPTFRRDRIPIDLEYEMSSLIISEPFPSVVIVSRV